MKTAFYAGTFDPVTNGHLWIIQEAHELFDTVFVAVCSNASKQPMFSQAERVKMIKESCSSSLLHKVKVITQDDNMEGQFTVKFAKSVGATHMIRGVRNESDFTMEQAINHINQDIDPSVKTMFMMPPRNLSEISSSMVKGLVGYRDWLKVVKKYVPSSVVKRFQAKQLSASQVMSRLGASWGQAKTAEAYLNMVYRESEGRVYHTETHIQECLDLLSLCVSDPIIWERDFDVIALALMFHDCVYDVTRSDNEEKSVGAFASLSGDMDGVIKQSVANLIMATKSHQLTTTNHATNIVSDIDMAILGSSPERFMEYENAIRFEYKYVLNAEFYPARKKLLLSWLHSSVYHTTLFKEMFEEKKNINIKALLATQPYMNGE